MGRPLVDAIVKLQLQEPCCRHSYAFQSIGYFTDIGDFQKHTASKRTPAMECLPCVLDPNRVAIPISGLCGRFNSLSFSYAMRTRSIPSDL